MKSELPGQAIKHADVNERARFDCLVAAIVASKSLSAGAQRPERVFEVYGALVRMVRKFGGSGPALCWKLDS